MPAGEFDLIDQLVRTQFIQRDEVALGIGDDAALLDVPSGYELVISTDTLNSGVHFPEDTSADAIGHKSLAVSLSDLAAMGAEPVAVSLSLSLPEADEVWLKDFARGFFLLADQYKVQLIGGDTTRGPLSIGTTIYGKVPKGQAIRRNGAGPGDVICVTGTLGDAGAALLALQGELKLTGPQEKILLKKLEYPQPRIFEGQAIRKLATACIDISDGLVADLGHILKQSNTGATIYVDQLPVSETLRQCLDRASGWHLAMQAGDDYELCFTVPEDKQAELEDIRIEMDLPITYIGITEPRKGLHLMMPDGSLETLDIEGYEHFRSS